MVDIEALGPRPDGALVSIGAFLFNQGDLEEVDSPGLSDPARSFYAVVDLQNALDAGCKVDASTLRWWLELPDAARAVLLQKGQPLESVLHALARFYQPHRAHRGKLPRMWGFPAHFDIIMIEDAYKRCKIACPWDALRAPRDVRTVSDTLQTVLGMTDDAIKALKPTYGVLHNALDDAKSQALWLQRMHSVLRSALRGAE